MFPAASIRILFFFFAISDCLMSQKDGQFVGDDCSLRQQCRPRYSECVASASGQKCDCKYGRRFNSTDSDTVCAQCRHPWDCSEATSLWCSSRGCECTFDYVSHYDSDGYLSSCVKKIHGIGDTCDLYHECTPPNSECRHSECQCKTGYHQITLNGVTTCANRSIGIGDYCVSSYECTPPNSECRHSECQCKTGYHQFTLNGVTSCTNRSIGIGDYCVSSYECTLCNSECRYSKCQCKTGYHQITLNGVTTCALSNPPTDVSGATVAGLGAAIIAVIVIFTVCPIVVIAVVIWLCLRRRRSPAPVDYTETVPLNEL